MIFNADSGGLSIINSETDASGVAQAELNTAGDPTNRPITVNATAGGQNAMGFLVQT